MANIVYLSTDDYGFFDGTTEVPNAVKISNPEVSAEVRDLPLTLGATTVTKRKIAIVDNGTATLTLTDDGSNVQLFRDKIGVEGSDPYTVKDGTADVLSYNAWVISVSGGDAESGNELNADIELSLDGTATWSYA